VCLFAGACSGEWGWSAVGADPLAGFEVEVSPTRLGFPVLSWTEESTAEIQLINHGALAVEVDSARFSGSSAYRLVDPGWPVVLEEGATHTVTVRFAPRTAYEHAGELSWMTDPRGALSTVALQGSGVPPDVTVDMGPFASTRVGCGGAMSTLRVSNEGGQPLQITDVSLEGAEVFTIVEGPSLPHTLAPSRWVEVDVWFDPSGDQVFMGSLLVQTTDRAEGLVTIPLQGEGVWEHPAVTETFVVGDRAVDLLLAVDRSGSMKGEQSHIDEAFEVFAARLEDEVPGTQVGVVTGKSRCFNGGVLTPTQDHFAADLREALHATGSGRTEALLALAVDAMTAVGSCNEGFRREDAALQVVVVSDEPDQSKEGWASLVDDLYAFTENPLDLHISGIVDVHEDCGFGAEGYEQAANFSEGVLLDICDPDIHTQIFDLVYPPQLGVDRFVLQTPPEPKSLEVWVNEVLDLGATYEERWGAVAISEEAEPGDTVRIHYRPESCG
jgi:hypothetical protein